MVKVGTSNIIRFSSTSLGSLGEMTGGERLNIKGSTISHMAAVHPGH